MTQDICLTVAERQIQKYNDEADQLMVEHREAMDCRDCEQFLQSGIEAFGWLKIADRLLREAHYSGVRAFTSEMRELVDRLYVAWLQPCARAEAWIQQSLDRGYVPDNLDEFRAICEEAEDAVQNRDWRKIAKSSREKTDLLESHARLHWPFR